MALILPEKIEYPKIFKTSRSTEVGITKPINTGTFIFREDLSEGDQPEVNEGEAVVWIPGSGIYDVPNSVLNTDLWTHTQIFGIPLAQETATYMEEYVNVGNQAAYQGKLAADDFPTLANMSEISFRCILSANNEKGAGTVTAALWIFGREILEISRGAGSATNDSAWVATKKDNGDWDITDDGVADSTITPLDNIIHVYISNDTSGGDPAEDMISSGKLYEITIDGRAYLIIGTSKGTFRKVLDQV